MASRGPIPSQPSLYAQTASPQSVSMQINGTKEEEVLGPSSAEVERGGQVPRRSSDSVVWSELQSTG
eukprot:443017-Rhodomonas_salina.5